MIQKKTNPPTHTEAKVTPPDMLRSVIIAGRSTRTAALQLCYASAAFILLVNHFQDAKADGYMTKTDAVKYLEKQIKEQAGVQGGMLDLYIRNASALVGCLVGSAKMFSSTIAACAVADTPDDIIGILSKWMDDNNGKRIESMSNLSEALGYKTSRPVPASDKALTPDKAITRVENVMAAVEKITGSGKGKVREQQVAQTIVAQAKSPATFAREAIKQVTDEGDLKSIEQACKDQRVNLRRLETQAKDKVAERKDHNENLPGTRKADKVIHGKGSHRGQRTPVAQASEA